MSTKKPTLIIMAAGLGSRYGGMKQIAPVDEQGHIIMDYSIFDAKRAGFEKVVCIIKAEKEADFEEHIGKRLRKYIDLQYAYQHLENLPEGFTVPEGRTKPWGTGHAVLSAAEKVDGPFAVINADDFYGADAYREIYNFLAADRSEGEHAMVGYLLKNTMSDSGSVARGICETDENGLLTGITERTKIEKRGEDGAYTEDDGKTFTPIAGNTTVSLNLFGFQHSMFTELKSRMAAYLTKALPENPLKCEYFLPMVVGQLLDEKKASVKVLHSGDKWYGITYAQDMPILQEAIRRMKDEGKYPQKLWD